MVNSPTLADILFSRVKPYLEDLQINDDPHKVHIHGIQSMLQGQWTPCRLNQVTDTIPVSPNRLKPMITLH